VGAWGGCLATAARNVVPILGAFRSKSSILLTFFFSPSCPQYLARSPIARGSHAKVSRDLDLNFFVVLSPIGDLPQPCWLASFPPISNFVIVILSLRIHIKEPFSVSHFPPHSFFLNLVEFWRRFPKSPLLHLICGASRLPLRSCFHQIARTPPPRNRQIR